MSWQWWATVVAFLAGLILLVGTWGRDRWRTGREEASQGIVGADDEWADTLHGIRAHIDEEDSLEDTGAIDMTWLRTHLDLEDVEIALHEGLRIVDHFVDLFLDDTQWNHIMDWSPASASSDVRV